MNKDRNHFTLQQFSPNNSVDYNSSHLAACGSRISASITWETSKQLCCCLGGQLKRNDIKRKKTLQQGNQSRNEKTEVGRDRGAFEDTAPRCEGWRNRRQMTTGVNQRSERQDF